MSNKYSSKSEISRIVLRRCRWCWLDHQKSNQRRSSHRVQDTQDEFVISGIDTIDSEMRSWWHQKMIDAYSSIFLAEIYVGKMSSSNFEFRQSGSKIDQIFTEKSRHCISAFVIMLSIDHTKQRRYLWLMGGSKLCQFDPMTKKKKSTRQLTLERISSSNE